MDPHRLPATVYMEDVDAEGIVYHANYLKYVERARTEILAKMGMSLHGSLAAGRLFLVHEMNIKWRRPARLGDQLEVRTTWERSSPFRATFRQDVYRGDERAPLVLAVVQVVTVDPKGTLLELPDRLFPG